MFYCSMFFSVCSVGCYVCSVCCSVVCDVFLSSNCV